MSNVAEAFEILKRMCAPSHIHDNAKDKDTHLWPGQLRSTEGGDGLAAHRAPDPAPASGIESDEKVNPLEKIGPAFGNWKQLRHRAIGNFGNRVVWMASGLR